MTHVIKYICDKIPTNATMSVADMTSELPGLGVFGRLWRHVGQKVNIPVDLTGSTRPLLARLAKTTRASRCSHNFGQTRNAFQNNTNARYELRTEVDKCKRSLSCERLHAA